MDAIGMMVGIGQAKIQNSVSVAVMRQQMQADEALLAMMAKVIEAQPAPGTGLVVDKRA